MAIDSFIPELWSAEILSALQKALVFGQGGVVNRDYEGEISQYGDTVHVNSVTDPTIGDYVKHQDITVQALTTTDQTLTISQSKYFGFEIDDIEARQARDNGALVSEVSTRAAYLLGDAADQFLAAQMKAGVAAGNVLPDATVAAAGDAYDTLVDLMVKLDTANVPRSGRWVVIPPALHGKLLRDDRFVRVDASGTSEGLRNGIVGRAVGFDILVSNNVPNGDATPAGSLVIAGHPMATSYAEQIAKTEATRVEKRFADMVKGLHLYGAKVFRGDCLAAVEVTLS
jgi:N4-gp56 family major capsid protein